MTSHTCCMCLAHEGEESPQRPWEEVRSLERELLRPMAQHEHGFAPQRSMAASKRQKPLEAKQSQAQEAATTACLQESMRYREKLLGSYGVTIG
eukprot:7243487-Prymnesium_polylepis.1